MMNIRQNQSIPNCNANLPNSQKKTVLHVCDICGYRGQTPSILKIHINAKHLKLSSFQCSFCDYKARYKCVIKRHMLMTHQLAYETKPLMCPRCQYATLSKERFLRHVSNKHADLAIFLNCEICGFLGNSEEELMAHINKEHANLEPVKYLCNVCGYESEEEQLWNSHVCDLDKLQDCPHCTFATWDSEKLSLHISLHSFNRTTE